MTGSGAATGIRNDRDAADEDEDRDKEREKERDKDKDKGKEFTGPEYRRLLDAARKSLEFTGGDLTRTITVKTPDDRERRAIIGITGRYRPKGVSLLAVSLTDLDHTVRAAAGYGLTHLLETLGSQLRSRPAERQRLALGREAAVRSAEDSILKDKGWFQSWLAELTADGTLTRLVNTGEADQVRQAARVLEWLQRRDELRAAPMQLADLASTITGDTKALSHGTGLSTLVLRALALRLGAARPRITAERRDLWDRSGVIVDDLVSRVLVLNLAADGEGLGEWLTSAKAHGTPFYVTLQQLVTMPITVRRAPVFACENPVVLRRAAAELGTLSATLICAGGQPSTAFHRIATAVTRAGGELSYHGDFDWPGVGIAAGLFARYNARPWRFGASDYENAVSEGTVLLAGTALPTPWDPALSSLMEAHGLAVYEEAASRRLVGDLRAGRRP